MSKKAICAISFLLLTGMAIAQPARVLNSSFEGEPRDATVPRGWHICKDGTTPDILPGPWGVYLDPADGDTYVGLITRDNGTWEAIGQRLTEPLTAGECYTVTMNLARSNAYMGFNNPVKLRIWGGGGKCEKTQLLVETNRIQNSEWVQHTFQFVAKNKIKFVVIEAFHQEGPFSYMGNVLIDGMSAFEHCSRAELISSGQ